MTSEISHQSLKAEVEKLIKSVDEWMVFGNWDTKRCPVCKGWKKRGGHKPNCQRQKLKGLLGLDG